MSVVERERFEMRIKEAKNSIAIGGLVVLENGAERSERTLDPWRAKNTVEDYDESDYRELLPEAELEKLTGFVNEFSALVEPFGAKKIQKQIAGQADVLILKIDKVISDVKEPTSENE